MAEHIIIVSFLGFETLKTTIQIPSNSDLIFKLKREETNWKKLYYNLQEVHEP